VLFVKLGPPPLDWRQRVTANAMRLPTPEQSYNYRTHKASSAIEFGRRGRGLLTRVLMIMEAQPRLAAAALATPIRRSVRSNNAA
jgi:hypothetical protein